MGLVNYLLVLRRLVPLAVSLGASVPDSSLHFRALWTVAFQTCPWPLPSSPRYSQEIQNLVYPSQGCFIACSNQENRELSLGRIFTSSKIHKLSGTPSALMKLRMVCGLILCDREWAQEKKNRSRHWVLTVQSQDAMCRMRLGKEE